MAWTFGAAVTDKIDFSGANISIHTTNRIGFLTCWVRPTTLTATRVIWASSAIYRLAIDTTTTSLRFTVDCATTDGTYIAPMGLAVNTWTFVAVMWNLGTGPTAAVRMWTGTETSAPVEQTVTATAGSGAFVNSGTVLTIGNANAGSLAFQGDIGGVVLANEFNTTTLSNICAIPATGAIAQADANSVYAAHISRLWRGDLGHIAGAGRQLNGNSGFGWQLAASLDTPAPVGLWKTRGVLDATTVTGATKSALITPRSFEDRVDNLMASGRRRGFLARAS